MNLFIELTDLKHIKNSSLYLIPSIQIQQNQQYFQNVSNSMMYHNNNSCQNEIKLISQKEKIQKLQNELSLVKDENELFKIQINTLTKNKAHNTNIVQTNDNTDNSFINKLQSKIKNLKMKMKTKIKIFKYKPLKI